MVQHAHGAGADHRNRPPFGWLRIFALTALALGCAKQPEAKAPPKDGAFVRKSENDSRAPAAGAPAKVEVAPPKRYVATKIAKPIKIDGKLDEPAWAATLSTGSFVDALTGNPGAVTTEAKLLWDSRYLYIGFHNVDDDVWGQLTGRDDKLRTQEAVEVMIDADGNGKGYIDLLVAPNGTIFDAYLPSYRKVEDSVDPKATPPSWNSGLKAAVKVDGTLNKRNDRDKGWSVEMALPLLAASGLKKEGVRIPPVVADLWSINLFRLESPKDRNQIAVALSAPMSSDLHRLDRFAELVFGNENGEYPPPWANVPIPTEKEWAASLAARSHQRAGQDAKAEDGKKRAAGPAAKKKDSVRNR